MNLTAIIRRGEKQYVALCPEVDVASQGKSVEEAMSNLKEAVDVYLDEFGLPEGVVGEELLVTQFRVKHAKTSCPLGA